MKLPRLSVIGTVLTGGVYLTMCGSEKPAPSPAPGPRLPAVASKEWIVSPRGVGPVQFGMTAVEARRVLGDSLAGLPADGGCAVLAPAGAPAGLTLMFENGRVVRADVDRRTVATDHGAMVGMSGAVIRELYRDSVVFTPHKYDPKGQYITITPGGADESQFRVVFEIDSMVLRFHAGILPAVEYVERCG